MEDRVEILLLIDWHVFWMPFPPTANPRSILLVPHSIRKVIEKSAWKFHLSLPIRMD
jgi:hypothetical protein